MTEPNDVQDIVEPLQKREHYFRHASEGEYDANLLMNARFEIERLRAALLDITYSEHISCRLRAELALGMKG